MEIPTPSTAPSASCLECGAPLRTEYPMCDRCGFTMVDARVYDPKHFVALGIFLTALVPIYLSASNWGKIGRRRTKRLWLGFGVLGFALLATLLTILPESTGAPSGFLSYAVNVLIARYLRNVQRPIYDGALRMGARPRSLLLGAAAGLGLTVLALALPVAGVVVGGVIRYQSQYTRGIDLLDRGEYGEAVRVFEDLLRQDPEDDALLLPLAISRASLEQYEEAAFRVGQYLGRHDSDAYAFAILARIRAAQGRQAEAERLASKAEVLRPGILEELFTEP